MTVKIEHGKAFVSKGRIKESSVFEGAALYESDFEGVSYSFIRHDIKICQNYFELDLYEFFSLAIIHSLPFLIEGHEKVSVSS